LNIPINISHRFPFFHIITNTCHFLFFWEWLFWWVWADSSLWIWF
jgi:hypothetical protein